MRDASRDVQRRSGHRESLSDSENHARNQIRVIGYKENASLHGQMSPGHEDISPDHSIHSIQARSDQTIPDSRDVNPEYCDT